jgi:diguanylate cyclase (GGDEF)-like protein
MCADEPPLVQPAGGDLEAVPFDISDEPGACRDDGCSRSSAASVLRPDVDVLCRISWVELDMEPSEPIGPAAPARRPDARRPSFERGGAPTIEAPARPQWRQGLPDTLVRVSAIEDAATAAVGDRLTPVQRERARIAARQLAESVSARGFVSAARCARAVEAQLDGTSPLSEATVLELCENAIALRRQLSPYQRSAAGGGQPTSDDALLVVYSLDADWVEEVRAESVVRGLAIVHAHDPAMLEDALDRRAAAAILDLRADATVLRGLRAALPPATVAVIATDRLADRLALVEAGIARVLLSDSGPREVVDPVVALLKTQRFDDARVLILGDEQRPDVAALKVRISELGAEVICAQNLNEAWLAVLDERPSLVVTLTATEESANLARIVRADIRRVHLPLVAVIEDEPDAPLELHRAGIDDVVTLRSGLTHVTELVRGQLIRSRMHLSDAEVDPLTGLPNEAGALRSVERLASLAQRQQVNLAMAVVQVDGFGRLNELHGRSLGDDVLQTTAKQLRQAFRGEDVAARLGASEFLLALYDSTREDAAVRIRGMADEIRSEQLTAPNGVPVRLTVSAGVAQLPTDGHEPRAVRRAATEALRHARASGGDQVVTTVDVDTDQRTQTVLDVVVVEGDEVLAAMLSEALSARGWRVSSAGDGQTALQLLGGPHPPVQARVVLLDVDLPGPDGYTVLRRLADAGALRDTRVIVVTGSATEAEILAAFEAGAADHVAKPFSLPVLIERVRSALGPGA